MNYELTGKVKMKLSHKRNEKTSSVSEVKIFLEPEPGLDRRNFFSLTDKKDSSGTFFLLDPDLPNRNGSKALTHLFTQGLVANIKYCSVAFGISENEQFENIIQQLKEGLNRVSDMDVTKGDFEG